mmetsp:Transcript_5915/g.12962  ORF Transcript_5915/g.12962 Transcript_5915/m.12962 type:complete len:205 (-) Transcript_5915:560-1174(-)
MSITWSLSTCNLRISFEPTIDGAQTACARTPLWYATSPAMATHDSVPSSSISVVRPKLCAAAAKGVVKAAHETTRCPRPHLASTASPYESRDGADVTGDSAARHSAQCDAGDGARKQRAWAAKEPSSGLAASTVATHLLAAPPTVFGSVTAPISPLLVALTIADAVHRTSPRLSHAHPTMASLCPHSAKEKLAPAALARRTVSS